MARPKILTTRDAADALGVTPHTINEYGAQHNIGVRLGSGPKAARVFTNADLDLLREVQTERRTAGRLARSISRAKAAAEKKLNGHATLPPFGDSLEADQKRIATLEKHVEQLQGAHMKMRASIDFEENRSRNLQARIEVLERALAELLTKLGEPAMPEPRWTS